MIPEFVEGNIIMKKIFSAVLFCVFFSVFAADIQLAKNDFNKSLGAWISPSYWGGELTRITENNRMYMQLTATSKGNKVFARAHGFSKPIRIFPDTLIKIKLRVKGEGKFNTGLLLYPMDSSNPAGYLRSEEVTLTGEFQDLEVTLRIEKCLSKILPIMEVQGEGKAIVESFRMDSVSLPGNEIKAVSSFQIVESADQAKELKFSVNTAGNKFFISEVNGKNAVTRPGNGSGEVTVKPQNLLPGMNEIIVSANGTSATVYIEVSNEYALDEATAKKITFDRPVKMLFLGDSLTEFYPGQNYFARLEFYLNKFNPGKVTLVNAGVGGDFITRVEQRLYAELTGKGAAYRQNMYKGIFKNRYDYIFIWLGHNDTVTSRISKHGKFAKPQISPEVQERSFRIVLKKLRELNPEAKIILIAPSPSDVKKFEGYDKRFNPKTQIYMFGKPEFVAAFDAVNRKLVKEFDLGYIEMTAAMSRQADIAKLYVDDGVHLSPLGGRIAAREILRFLAGTPAQAAEAAGAAEVAEAAGAAGVKAEYIPEYQLETKLTGNDFKKSLHSWNSPGYWAGKVAAVTENDRKFLELSSGTRGKEVFGRAHGYCKNINLYPGTVIQIKVRVKGQGKFNTGIICYPWKGDNPAGYMRGGEVTLTDEFQYLTDFIVLPEKYSRILPIMEVQGEGKAVVEFFEMHSCIDPNVKLDALSSMQIVKDPADAGEVAFNADTSNGKAMLSIADSRKVRVTEIAAKGKVTVRPEDLLPGINEITLSSGGKHASVFIEVNDEFSADDEIAGKIRVDQNINVLFLGGSHCEFYPGQNFISRLGFWLEKYNPGKVHIFNHGVAGDFITRVEQRLNAKLNGQNPAWRQNMYDTIFDQQYDYIFMFLGQNDTVTSRISKHGKFARPQVTPDVQEKSYRRVFKILLEKNPRAKIVIISPSPSYVKLFEDYDKRFAPGSQIHMFGKKEFLDAYDAVNRKLVKEFDLGYIDMLNTMRQTPDMRSLYGEDGVHLTPRGGMIVARGILQYFASARPEPADDRNPVPEPEKKSSAVDTSFPLFPEDLIFYHGFENSLTADLSSGKAEPVLKNKNPKFEPGLHGSALFCGRDGGTFLRFLRKGNLNFDQPGTVIFFCKPLNWEADRDKNFPRLFFWGIDSGKGFFSLQGANDPKDICMCQRKIHLMFLYGKRIPNKVYELPAIGNAGCEEKWHMFAFSWAGNKLYFKWNDHPAKSVEHSAGVQESDFPADYFSIGSGSHWKYLLDDFMVYSRRLNSEELDLIYKSATAQ